MFRDPVDLIDQSIENLRTLAELFADEAGERLLAVPPSNAQARVCKEALQTIRVLLPKLQEARVVQMPEPRAFRPCAVCED